MLAIFLTTFLAILSLPSVTLGNVETLKATHTYVMGDHDSKEDARQRCLLEAKRQILEQAGVHIESASQVKDLSLTKDMIYSYAAAVMRIKDIKERVGFQNGNMTMTLTITAEVDPAEVRKQLANHMSGSRPDIPSDQAERLKHLETGLEEIQKKVHITGVSAEWANDPTIWGYSDPQGIYSSISNKDIQGLIAKANQGDARAQNSLGWLYQFGKGVEGDSEKAKAWFNKAATGGNAMAQIQLYLSYSIQPHGAENGMPWLMRAAEQGNAVAQAWLGVLYSAGYNLPEDMGKARHWYQKSATQGTWFAQLQLGKMYDAGWGVPKDDVRAYMWFSLVTTNVSADPNIQQRAAKRRDSIAKYMSPAQVTEAQRMECKEQELKGC